MFRVKVQKKEANSGWTDLYFTAFADKEKAVAFAKSAYIELYNQVFFMGYTNVGDITEEVDEKEGEFYAYTYTCGPEINVEVIEVQ